eukprot:Transcript_25440.p1 GENE.Transcript_25440~~Transcript_25440.p1  ORF type:complete len:433 (-),score=118.24 Transcript_25440:585-1883(-)
MTRQYMRTEEQVFTDKTRELLRLQVHNPSSPFNLIIMVVILIATLAMVLETVDDLNQYINEKEWAVIEAVCVVIFTIELIIKLFVTPVRKLHLFFFSVMNLVDVVAILPFYLTLLTSAGSSEECWTGFLTVFRDNGLNVTSGVDCSTTGGTSFTFLRAFRLARVMRVLKLGNFSAGVKVFTVAIMKSTPQLVAIFFFMMIAMIVFSSIMYYAETGCNADAVAVAAGADDAVACVKQKESFSSIPMTMWWCIVTMTTVGYGDMVPKSPVGMVIAVPTMLAGILIFALPITVIGSNYEAAFHNEVMKRLINELHAGIRQLFKTKSEISLQVPFVPLRTSPDHLPTTHRSRQDVQRLTKKWSSRWTSDHTQARCLPPSFPQLAPLRTSPSHPPHAAVRAARDDVGYVRPDARWAARRPPLQGADKQAHRGPEDAD